MSARGHVGNALGVLIVATLLLIAPRVLAQPDPVLPLGDIDRFSIAVVPGSAPSLAHPSGTALVLAAARSGLVAQEWDLATKTLVQKRLLAALPEDRALVAERIGGEIYVVVATASDIDEDEVVLLAFDGSLAPRGRQVIGHGSLPSLAVNDRYILTGFHEKHDPTLAKTSPESRVPPADLALHVAVRDRATMQVVGARVFQGDELLYTTVLKERSMHAVALDGDRATFALTGLAKIVVTSVSLPSLHTAHTTRIARLGTIEAAPLFALPGHRVIVDTVGHRHVFSSDLSPVEQTSLPVGGPEESCARPAHLWSTRVAVCGGTSVDEGPAPASLAVRRTAK